MKVFKNYVLEQGENKLLDIESSHDKVQNGELAIVVLDRGWVFAGALWMLDNDEVKVTHCLNVHCWGTEKGLGELALNGPTKSTILNPSTDIYCKPIFTMKINNDNW